MKHLLTLCIGFFMLLSCNNKSSQSAAIATDEPEVNEDTLFRVIDLANNLKPCSDSLLLSDIVEDVEYVKLEAADNALVGEMYKGYVSDSAIFFSCIGSPIRPHIFMFDRFTGKFIRTIGKSGQGPGEMYSPVNVVAKDSLVYLSSDYRDELFVYKIKTLPRKSYFCFMCSLILFIVSSEITCSIRHASLTAVSWQTPMLSKNEDNVS